MGTTAVVMLIGSWLKFSDMPLCTACFKIYYCIHKCCATYLIFYYFTYMGDCCINVFIPFIDVPPLG